MLKLPYLVLYVEQVKKEEHFITLKKEGKHIFLPPPLPIEHAVCYLLTKEIHSMSKFWFYLVSFVDWQY